jgi:hypothetical protein
MWPVSRWSARQTIHRIIVLTVMKANSFTTTATQQELIYCITYYPTIAFRQINIGTIIPLLSCRNRSCWYESFDAYIGYTGSISGGKSSCSFFSSVWHRHDDRIWVILYYFIEKTVLRIFLKLLESCFFPFFRLFPSFGLVWLQLLMRFVLRGKIPAFRQS